jgi:hypothetical protein
MKPNAIRLARFGALLLVAVAALAATARAPRPFDTSAWAISAAESRVEPYRGRTALLLREGTAWLRDSRFQNGTIEFDIAFSEASGFPGIAFRAATHADYELFYLRENLSGQPHATQYTPVLHGLYAWQIYAGPAWEATAQWTYDRWMHVKLVVSGRLTAASGTTRCTATCTPAASWVHSASTASARSGGGANSW